MADAEETQVLHGSAVVLAGKGCLIIGASGSGKSTLAIELMALGADLISDDQVMARASGDGLILAAPPSIPQAIEARHVGLLRVDLADPAPLSVLVDLDSEEPQRLPPDRSRDLLGRPCPVIFGRNRPALAPILAVYLRGGGPVAVD
jgi:HPr kinase/phosphorylase